MASLATSLFSTALSTSLLATVFASLLSGFLGSSALGLGFLGFLGSSALGFRLSRLASALFAHSSLGWGFQFSVFASSL